MKFSGTFSIALATLSLSPIFAADQPKPAAPLSATTSTQEGLQEVIRAWIQTNRDLDQLEKNWKNDEQVLSAYRSSLQQEIESIKKDIEAEKPYDQERASQLKESEAELETYKKTREAFAKALPALEDQALALYVKLPDFLLEDPQIRTAGAKLEQQVKNRSLPEFDPNKELNNRLMAVLGILREAEKHQSTITVKASAQDSLNVDTVYFGLGQAYRADRDGKRAWIGRLSDGKFTFSPADKHASQIRELILVAKEEAEAKMVKLPLKATAK